MCIYPKYKLNPKYLPNKKNGGNPPACRDERKRWIKIDCNKCYECRKKYSREWKIRLIEELRSNNDAYFITLTFSEESYNELKKKYDLKDENKIATKAIRLLLERIRKEKGKSIKHFFVTELGHEKTKRLHLHGITWNKEYTECLLNKWKYGITFTGTYVSIATMNYIVKYITKKDIDNIDFNGIILATPGLGKSYLNRIDAKINEYNGYKTNTNYTLPNGVEIPLPKYYKNKLYDESQRNALWTKLLDDDEFYINGWKYKGSDKDEENKLLEEARLLSYEMDKTRWDLIEKNKSMKRLKSSILMSNEQFEDNVLETLNELSNNEFLKMFNEKNNEF